MRAIQFKTGRFFSSALIVSALTLAGCGPRLGAYGAVYATSVPYDIYSYPHVYYNGANAYLVGDQWYYPQSRGWVVLRNEPPSLYRYRSYYGGAAPPPYGRGYSPGYGSSYGPSYGPYERRVAPPAYPQPYAYPPPAQRVR